MNSKGFCNPKILHLTPRGFSVNPKNEDINLQRTPDRQTEKNNNNVMCAVKTLFLSFPLFSIFLHVLNVIFLCLSVHNFKNKQISNL